jgi:Protein of unknown function (DUF3237)
MPNNPVLFQAALQYLPDAPPVDLGGRPKRSGELLGSGDGVIQGATLQGRVHWSIFEVQGPVCETTMVGVITTDDGATIQWETRGYGVVPDQNQPNQWYMPAVVKFTTASPLYSWLNTTLATWEGTFDRTSGLHTYQAYYRPV